MVEQGLQIEKTEAFTKTAKENGVFIYP